MRELPSLTLPVDRGPLPKLDANKAGEYDVFTETPSHIPLIPHPVNDFPSRPQSRFRSGFSLLELMVTITIIVVLFSISMPAYNLIKKRAYWSKTPGQMSKVIGAFHAYSADHNGYFPPAYFPEGAESAAGALADDVEGQSGWLNSTIFTQMYADGIVSSGSGESSGGSSSSYEQSDKGYHLKDTVFEIQASVLAFPQDDNLYNHTFLLNRSLATERNFKQEEFAPRRTTIFADLSSIMLLTEGLGGEQFNSISVDDAGGDALEQGFARYDNRFVHVGYMDGRVVQLKRKEFPESLDAEVEDNQGDPFIFWKGVTRKEFETLIRTDTGRINY